MKAILANPRGFCAGVDRAIEIVDRALELFGAPIYVRHEVVHNRYVVNNLRDRGAIFVEELDEVPDGKTVIFSAHGVSQAVKREAEKRRLKVFDATCPLVTKVHMEVMRFSSAGQECVLIGHKGHPEVDGTMGQYDHSSGGSMYLVETPADVKNLTVNNPQALSYVTQTTLSMDDAARVITALRQRFPEIEGPRKDDICYATQNRQDAVRALSQEVDMMLVVGSSNSSNSNRLRELAEQQGISAYLVDTAMDIEKSWLKDVQAVGVTAGASAPAILIEEVIEQLQQWGVTDVVRPVGVSEGVSFSLPKALRVTSRQ